MDNKASFKKIQRELKSYLPLFAKAEETILEQEISSFPIFVIHQAEVNIGINIADRESVKGEWSVNASTLEEFVTKQLIDVEKVDEFKVLYKNHQGELCLFVIVDSGASFVFMPQ